MSNPAPTLNQINAFNATQGTTIDFNIIGGTEVIRSNKIYIYDLSDNSLICTHLYVSTESIHELPANTDSSIVYESGKSSADFVNGAQYYAQIQTFTDVAGTQGGSGLSIAKLFWCLPTPTLTLSTIPTTISTTSYNVSATYTPNTSGGATNEIQEFQFNLYSAIGALLQTSGVVLYGEGVDLSYNFSGLGVDSTYYVTLDVTTTQGMNVSAQSNTFTVSIDTPTMGSASVVNNGCDGYISVTSNLSSEYEHEESVDSGEIMSFTTDSVNDIIELDVDFEPVQDGTPWMSTPDTEPYMFRAVPTQTEDFGHESDTIVGGTVAWNQLVQNGNFADTSVWNNAGYGTFTVSNNVCTYTITDARTSARIEQSLTPIIGHKVLSLAEIKCSYDSSLVYTTFTASSTGSIAKLANLTANTWYAISGMKTIDSNDITSGKLRLYFGNGASVNDTVQLRNVQFLDLTAMFGSTIADYIYSLEQATTGAGVAWFRKLFPKPYYAYNAGELISVNTSSHDMVGFNQFDKNTAVRGKWITNSSGTVADADNAYTLSDFIRVVPNTTYYHTGTGSSRTLGYDADQNPISTTYGIVTSGAGTFTTPSNVHYVRATLLTANVDSFCLNKSDASLNGTYKPYTKHSYPLDSTLTLRGIPKLDASNNLYYDGDIYASDGTVTRRYGIVDLGTLNWGYYADSGGYFGVIPAGLSPQAKPANQNVCANIIVSKDYTPRKTSEVYTTGAIDMSIGIHSNGALLLQNTSYGTDYAALKTSLSGTYLVYELATPTTKTADPYTNPQIVDPNGTEEYVGSPIPVGHETTYQRICPISGWDSVEVDVVGKNLFDGTLEQGTFTNQGAESAAGSRIRTKYVLVDSGDVSISTPTSNVYIHEVYCYDANNAFISRLSSGIGASSGTVTVPSGAKYIRFSLRHPDNSTITPSEEIKVQVELSATPTPYQPYNGTTYTSTFPKYKQQVTQDKTPYITKNIGDTYADTLTENLVGGTIAWNQLKNISSIQTQTDNGVTFTNNGDGSITANGTATGGDAVCDLNAFNMSTAGVYLFTGCPKNGSLSTYRLGFATGGDVGNGYMTKVTNPPMGIGHRIYVMEGTTVTNLKFIPQIYNLTQMFGSTIADAIYAMEQAITRAGVAWFRKLFPNDDYDYNSGALISVNASAHVIKDASGNVVNTYPLDSDLVLRGIPKLDANNKLYYDGDVYEPDGSVTRKYGHIADLSQSGWSYSNGFFYITLNDMKQPSTIDERKIGCVCAKYKASSTTSLNSTMEDKAWLRVGGNFYVRDDSYNADVATFKSGLSGYGLVYELATPTTEQADPFEENQAIVPNGIEEYTVTEQGDVEMPVGHDSTYYATEVYGGTIDMASGVLTITHKSMTLDGTENGWQAYANGDGYAVPLSDMKPLNYGDGYASWLPMLKNINSFGCNFGHSNKYLYINHVNGIGTITDLTSWKAYLGNNNLQIVYELETPITIQLTPQQIQTLSGQNNIWSNTNGGMYLVYQLPITSLLVKRRDVADVSGKWLTLYSTPITQASDMDFTFIDFLNQYGKTYQYALVPVLEQDQSGVVVQIEGGYTVSDNVDSIFDGVYIADQTNVERVKAGVGYGNVDMNQGVGSITPIGSKYPIVITNSQNQYHNGSVRGTIVPNDFYSNGNLSRIDMVNKRDELEQFLTNKRAKIIKDWNGKMWLVMIMSNVACSFDDNYGMGMVSFSADWLEVGDPTNQQDLYNAGLINVGGV